MNSTDVEDLRAKIKLAREAVEGESEPYKTESYKIILSKLLDGSNKQNYETLSHESKSYPSEIQSSDKTFELAKKCNLTVDELRNVLSIKDTVVEMISPLTGSDAQKHIIVTLCMLVSYEIIGQEWVSASILAESLRSLGIKDLANLSKNLKKHPELFRTRGGRRHKEYRLTSGEGRLTALRTIQKLAKGDKFEN